MKLKVFSKREINVMYSCLCVCVYGTRDVNHNVTYFIKVDFDGNYLNSLVIFLQAIIITRHFYLISII